jgi:DNA polymerase I-like protein with 3'-5' exonuclease and polymerase domains
VIEIKRSIGVYDATFLEMESDPDGRVRSSYKLTGTDTFRLASSENAFGRGGNLQNIPSGKETEIEIDFKFPNVRRQFIPDTGYTIGEFDLSGADAQVVAWEANDDDLKAAFRAGLKLHLKNARDVYPDKTRDMTDLDITEGQAHEGGLYSNVKKLAHGTNFGGTAKGLAERIRITVRDAEEFQERWFYLHPGIKTWHEHTNQKLVGFRCWSCEEIVDGKPYCPHCGAFPQGRTIGNRFGNRIVYFERVRDLFNPALAWTPQSTTAINCNRGAIALIDRCPWVELLMQVHDSLIAQWPSEYDNLLPEIGRALHSVTVPYSDPLTIPWSVKIGTKNWGDCEKIKWPEGTFE